VSNLPERVEKSILARKLFKRGQRILVAVSGGVDSMVLLHLLHTLATRHHWQLMVAHFNHQLRGRASDGDERFVTHAAKSLGLPVISERGDVKQFSKRYGISIEMAGRQLRHGFLSRTARRLKIRSVAVGHHADDQVELFFLRLLRGAGGDGLGGMKWSSPSPADRAVRLVRALLDTSKTDIEFFARQNKIKFRRDASNASLDIARNRIRHELLPLLRSRYQPALEKNVLRAADILAEESAFVTLAAESWFKQKKDTPFAKLSIAVQRQCLRLQLLRSGVSSDFDLIERLRKLPGAAVSVGPTTSVARDDAGGIQLRTADSASFQEGRVEICLNTPDGEALLDGVCCRWAILPGKRSAIPKPRPGRECFDAEKIGDRIVLRHWQPGDRFRPIGMRTWSKLQDWFTNRKVPRSRRHELLLAEAASGEIFWVEGERIAERFKITPTTRRQLLWSWLRTA
jgi:tRNA(Ile)-lysidine synthase